MGQHVPMLTTVLLAAASHLAQNVAGIKRRARDSNPQGLAPGGFQVLAGLLFLLASGCIWLRTVSTQRGELHLARPFCGLLPSNVPTGVPITIHCTAFRSRSIAFPSRFSCFFSAPRPFRDRRLPAHVPDEGTRPHRSHAPALGRHRCVRTDEVAGTARLAARDGVTRVGPCRHRTHVAIMDARLEKTTETSRDGLASWPPPITEKTLMLTPCRGPVLLHLRP